MICDVMPPIPEDGGGNGTNLDGTGSDNGEEAEANIEQLMVSMLEERDKVRLKKGMRNKLICSLVARKITRNGRYIRHITTKIS